MYQCLKQKYVRNCIHTDSSDTKKNQMIQVAVQQQWINVQKILSFEYLSSTETVLEVTGKQYLTEEELENGSISESDITWHVSLLSVSEVQDKENGDLGCEHYLRGAKMLCPDCHRFFTCRFCHNASCEHEMDRYAVEYMACMYCLRIQVVITNACHPESRPDV